MQSKQNKLYVGNLSFSITEPQLREFFSTYGNITEIAIPTDKHNGQARGFAFITYSTQAEAQAALDANGKELAKRPLKVNVAQDRDRTTGGSGGSGGGRSGGGRSRW